MPFRREFIDWGRPALSAAAEWLAGCYADGQRLDLRNVVAAVPGGRAGRRLLEALVDRAEADGLDLVPPQIVTAGALPELLYVAKKPFADDLTQHLAWVAALRKTDRSKLVRLARRLPESNDALAWLPLGEMLAHLHRELAADRLDCRDVLDQARTLPSFPDASRWELLAEIQRRYHDQLDALELWDRQTARLFAIRHGECRTERDIVLIGTVDMNRSQREMLDQVADRLTALVFAPSKFAGRFDEHGCVIPEAWQEAEIAVDPKLVAVVDGPGDEADAVVRALASFDGRFPAEDVVVGVPDERLVPYVEQRLEECELPVRYGVGTPVAQSEPCRLLEAVAGWLDNGRFDAFADLLRHPALERWLMQQSLAGDALSALDEVQAERLPWELRPAEIREVVTDLQGRVERCRDELQRKSLEAELRTYQLVEGVLEKVSGLTEALRKKKLPLGDWGDEIGGLLVAVYGEKPLDSNEPGPRRIVAACHAVQDVLVGHRRVPEALSPKVTGAEALRLTLQALSGETIPPPAEEAAIELLGWLELPLDDAPALVVAGFNEGIVPSSRNADLFLPNELRKHLGLEDNDRRYARDAYALSVLAASRQELRIVVGRRTAENDPLVPSRLLFACDAVETARRVRLWMGEEREAPGRLQLPAGLRPGSSSSFTPPKPAKLPRPVESMKVTEFRDYLTCPYRYYLRHRLRLKKRNDASLELNAPQFGNLLHEVLSRFGNECLRDPAFAASTSAGEIEEFLTGRLDELVDHWHGADPLPAVKVQVELVRGRLRKFAEWQAGWARDGWRVRYVEHDIPGDEAALQTPAGPMKLRGRIDRIDGRGDETVVFDYKTGDAAKSPEETHWSKTDERWLDLQLPLYRHACRWLDVGPRVQVGYVVLPRQEDRVGDRIAEWDEAMIETGVREAERIAALVRGETFWPPEGVPPRSFEEYAAICGDYRFVSPPPEEFVEEGAGNPAYTV